MAALKNILSNLFTEFDAESIYYVLVRDYASTDAINECDDLDVSVSEECRTKAIGVLKKQGWFTPKNNFNNYSHQQFYKWDGEGLYKLDIIWGFYFDDGRYKLADSDTIYLSSVPFNCTRIPEPKDGVLLLLLHVLLDKNDLSKKNMEFGSYLLSRVNRDNKKIIEHARLLFDGGYPNVYLKPTIIKDLYREGVIKRGPRLKSLFRRLYNRFVSHFQRRQVRVALIGVDGSGKSSALNSLKQYYGDYVFTQYFGFRDYHTKVARRACSENRRIKNKYLDGMVKTVAIYIDMWYRYFEAIKSKKRLLLFDRYAWEAADNASVPVVRGINELLFRRFFPKVDAVVYLFCPVETSLRRKNDIKDAALFAEMKKRFDSRYKSAHRTLSIDTSITPESIVLGKIVSFIGECFN